MLRHYLGEIIDRLILRQSRKNYRQALFEDLLSHKELNDNWRRILEIGPKDGEDTRRLLQLQPQEVCLVDLPLKAEANQMWLRDLPSEIVRYYSGNIMYERFFDDNSFDLIWCTGVLYHNPEQLRMVRRLYDLLRPGGMLVLETATIKYWLFKNQNAVQILYPFSEELKRRYHVSANVTHLPSRLAVWSWLHMVGFERVELSSCHRQQSLFLAANRAAYLARRPKASESRGVYYASAEERYLVGKAL